VAVSQAQNDSSGGKARIPRQASPHPFVLLKPIIRHNSLSANPTSDRSYGDRHLSIFLKDLLCLTCFA
jgi:hypothetical protein